MKVEPRVSKKVRKGDKVVVIAGNFKGLTGSVLSCSGEKVVVEGLNIRKRHQKGQRNQPGQILQREKPIHISNVKPCNADGKPVKLRVRQNDKGERQFYYNDGNKETLYRPEKKS